MKNFLMRGVLLVTLLSSLVLPASAAFSNTDSQNIANIKSYTYDIKTAVTSGTLFTNVSAIATSVKNISSTVSSIYTQIQATNNHLSTGNSNTSAISSNTADIKSRIGSLTNTGYRSIAEAMLTLGGKLDTSNSKITSFDSNVSSKLGSVITNTNLISTSNSYLNNISSNSSVIKSNVGTISSDLKTASLKLDSLASESTLIAFTSSFLESNDISTVYDSAHSIHMGRNKRTGNMIYGNYSAFFSGLYQSLCQDKIVPPSLAVSYPPTLYSLIHTLQKTLASDEDRAIRDSQNDNVGQIKQDFISGSSGGTSLGKDDFGGLSSAGSAAKDLTSLNGQASIGKFTDGLSEANTSGLGWFSADTKYALDTVPASSGMRAPARDSDPYNMSGFSDNYN